MSVPGSTPTHIPLKYRCPDSCYVRLGHANLMQNGEQECLFNSKTWEKWTGKYLRGWWEKTGTWGIGNTATKSSQKSFLIYRAPIFLRLVSRAPRPNTRDDGAIYAVRNWRNMWTKYKKSVVVRKTVTEILSLAEILMQFRELSTTGR